jgi:hypothetical protein
MRATLGNQTNTTKQLSSEVSLLLLFSTLFFILPQGKNATCFAFTPSHFPSPSSKNFPFLSRMYIQNAQGNLNVGCPVLYSFSSLFRYLGRFTRGMPRDVQLSSKYSVFELPSLVCHFGYWMSDFGKNVP